MEQSEEKRCQEVYLRLKLQVVHKKTLAFLMTRIGTFKIDISTVYQQPGTVTVGTDSKQITHFTLFMCNDFKKSP